MPGHVTGSAQHGEIKLIPTVFDELARDNPEQIITSIPIGNDFDDGYRDVTSRTFADAVNRASWFLEKQLGRSEDFQTICYLGPSDTRYPILMLAGAKAGYKTFWTSPRNSLEGHLKLNGGNRMFYLSYACYGTARY